MKDFVVRKLLSWTAAAALFTGVATAGLISSAAAQQAPEVELIGDEFAAYADTVANFEAMNVRIADPDGNLVLDIRSDGDPVVWSPSADDLDGLYRYEVVVITRDLAAANAAEEGEANDEPGVGLVRSNGSFEIRGGSIVEPRERESSLWDAVLRVAGVVLDTIGEALIPSAQAQDLIAESAVPTLYFWDTGFGASGGLREFAGRIEMLVPDKDDQERVKIRLRGRALTLDRFIDIDSDASGDRSLTIDLNGDIGLADNTVFIDRTADRVGIGTAMPQAELQINAASPELRFVDETGGGSFANIEYNANDELVFGGSLSALHVSGSAEIRMSNFFSDWALTPGATGLFVVDNANSQFPLFIENGAGNNTLVVDSNERIGIGTNDPSSTLEVTKADGTSQVLVDENSATTANRTLIQLENNGRPQIQLSNTASGVNWTTGMGSDDAYIIRRGANEYRFTKGGRVRWFQAGAKDAIFDFNNNGNLTIAGTLSENSDVNAKRDIAPVDGRTILARVAALPVSTWTYRDDESRARHVGPMAQDFHAAFALGANDTSISPRDVAGVALAAVQALQEVVRQRDARFDRMLNEKNARIAALRAQHLALQERMEALESRPTR